MKKHLLALSLFAALGVASAPAQVTIEGSTEEYTSISAAVAAAQTGAVINVTESYTETTAINPTDKKLTIKGGEGVKVSFGEIFLVSLQNKDCSLTIENLAFECTRNSANTRPAFAIGRGSLFLNNVEISGVKVKSGASASETGAVISASNGSDGNTPDVVLNNVTITDCECVADVYTANNNLSLKGAGEYSVKIAAGKSIKSADGFIGHATLMLDAESAANSVIVKNCTNPSLFTLEGVEGMRLQAQDGNLVLAEMPVVLNETTGTGYATLPAAVIAAESGAVLVLYKDVTVGSRIDLGAKVLTVKGATGAEKIDCGYSNLSGRYLFNLNTAGAELTLEGLVINGGNTERTAALLQPSNGVKLTVKNVTFEDFIATDAEKVARGLIDNPGSNPGTWHLDGVTFENCTVPNQLVTSNAAGNSIAGDNNLTLRINVTSGNYCTVDAANVSNATPVSVTLGNVGEAFQDKPVFTNCTDTEQFTCANDGYYFSNFRSNGNLIVRKLGSTGIAEVEAEDGADAEWYNLQGMRVQPTAPGVYIKHQGGKAVKVYKK